MTDHLDRPLRARPPASARDRIRRITSGLEHEADTLAEGVLVPKHRRLAPVEHWRPRPEEPPEASPSPAKEAPVVAAQDEVRTAASPGAPAGQPSIVAGLDASEAEAATAEEGPPPATATKASTLGDRWRRLARNRAWTASWLDRLLITIEVMATLGLVAAALASFNMVDRLQQDLARLAGQPALAVPTQAATATPTPEPSPTPQPVEPELPGGRNAPTPAATPSAQPPSLKGARIIIPIIRVDAPIVEGDDWETLKRGVGHHIGSGLPGQAGNMVLAAHNDVYGAIFKDLGSLQEGDLVLIDTPERTYRYRVNTIRIVSPKETSVMGPTAEPTLTLITCYPPLVDTHRLVVSASFVR